MTSRRPVPITLVYALAFAWILGKAAAFRALVPPGIPPDEPAHVSYVAYLEETGRFVPDYGEMRILDDSGRWSPLPIQLAHPSAYYAAIGRVGRLAGVEAPAPLGPLTRRLRRVSAPLFAAGAALFLWLGYRRPAPLGEHVVFAASVATVPSFAFVGSAVNNDVLAFLSGGILLVGLVRVFEGRLGALTATLVGAGLALSLLSKATAGLLALLAVAGALVVLGRRHCPRGSVRLLLTSLAWLVLPAAHYVPVLLRYGTPVPTLAAVDTAAFARSAFVSAPGWTVLPLVPWGAKLLKLFASTGLSIVSHVALPVGPAWSLAGPALLLALAAYGATFPRSDDARADRPGLLLARIGALAFALTFVVNLAWCRAGYLATGYVGGLQARYYLPFLPCLSLAAAAGFRYARARAWLAGALALLLVLFDLGVTLRFLALVRA